MARQAYYPVKSYLHSRHNSGENMKINDRVTVKTDGGPRRSGTVMAIEPFNEGTMYLVSLEDYPLGVWFFNEEGHPDGIFVEKGE